MDASNPVIVSERVKFSQMRNDQLLLKRQDYPLLEKLMKEGKRRDPETFPLVPEVPVDPSVLKRLLSSGVLPVSNEKLNPPLSVQKDQDGRPARLLPSEKYHPRGINMTGAFTSVNRKFVSRKRLEKIVESLLKFNPNAAEHIEKVTYTGGTKSGFNRRLAKWADRKPKNMKPIFEKWGINPFEVLRETMPLKGKLLDWNKELNELLDTIYINRASSAGPPFFQQKAEVQDKVFDALEQIAKAISDGTIKDFFQKNPEFLVSECKNKMDRYEMAKVFEKTRPYWCFSAPICMLISILCQDFCSNLATFDVDQTSVNAYGFSYAHGGGKRMWDWMVSVPEGRTKVCIYGDDVKKVFRKGGILYQVNPDFEQMDGSLDQDTVSLTVEWVYKSYELKYGENKFFRYVCDMWKQLAIGSPFLVDGPDVYSNKTGLLTGIVGTTLFDTVKSVFAYYLYEHQRIDPFNVEASEKFFAEMGLKIKEGTWDPQVVMEELEEGAVCSDQKFLGANLVVIAGRDGLEPVPAVEEEDLIKLIGNVRQQVVGKGTTLERRIFDTARGYMITGAYLHPRLWNSMADLVKRTPSTVITMRLQAVNEKGEIPELIALTGEDFEWPTSDGVPSINFCKNVFLSKENQLEDAEWIEIFPDLGYQLKEYRKKREYLPHGTPITTSWNEGLPEEVVSDNEKKIQEKREPICDIEEGSVLTNEVFRLPKYFAKFRPGVKVERKEELVKEAMESYESIHHQALDILFPYGVNFMTEQMLKLGFYPTANGYWTRDERQKMKRVTSSWAYNARVILINHYAGSVGESSASAKSLPKEADIAAEDVVVEPWKVVRDYLPKWKYPAAEMEDISYVTSIFMMSGAPLKVASQVLSQVPSRIQVTVSVENKFLGSAVAPSKNIAKKRLFEKIREMITNIDPPEDILLGGDVEENPGPNFSIMEDGGEVEDVWGDLDFPESDTQETGVSEASSEATESVQGDIFPWFWQCNYTLNEIRNMAVFIEERLGTPAELPNMPISMEVYLVLQVLLAALRKM